VSTRLVLTFADVTTDARTDDDLTVEGIETFHRITYQTHQKHIAYATAIDEQQTSKDETV
jgi:hypothetical protein